MIDLQDTPDLNRISKPPKNSPRRLGDSEERSAQIRDWQHAICQQNVVRPNCQTQICANDSKGRERRLKSSTSATLLPSLAYRWRKFGRVPFPGRPPEFPPSRLRVSESPWLVVSSHGMQEDTLL